jgi:hypothetical protein
VFDLGFLLPSPVRLGLTRSPNDAWIAQQLREATPSDQPPRFLVRDNDNKFGGAREDDRTRV